MVELYSKPSETVFDAGRAVVGRAAIPDEI
jgi:hypothetical protein